MTSMGPTRTRNSRFSVFFNFSFLGEKWGTRNEKSIFFIFCLILDKFWYFLKIFQSTINIFVASEAIFLGIQGVKSWTALIWYIQIILQLFQFLSYSLPEREIFLVFFSFLARNGLKFLVSREKSKCEKFGTYKLNG